MLTCFRFSDKLNLPGYNNLSVGNDLFFRGVNSVDEDDSTWNVGRNLSVYVNNESVSSVYDPGSSDGSTIVGGNFTYVGSAAGDYVFLNGTDQIGGNVNINLGNFTLESGPFSFGSGFAQRVNLEDAMIGGNVTVQAGLNTIADDLYESNAGTNIGGSIYLNLGGGSNVATLLGSMAGSSLTYIGGGDVDDVSYGMTGGNPRITAMLGAGDDTFTLEAGSALSYLYIDFGSGTDVFTNNFGGPFTFPFYFRNLP